MSESKPSIGLLRDSGEDEDMEVYAGPRVEASGKYLRQSEEHASKPSSLNRGRGRGG